MNILSSPKRLKMIFAVTVLAAAAVEGTVLARQQHVPAGRDAFLNYQVDSTDELVAVLKKNKTLRQRYAKHFGIPESRVIEFVKEALVPFKITADCTITDHGVTKTGRIYPVQVKLKKGTRVWATRSGVPVLKWACANPLAKTMPGTLMPGRPRSVKPNQIASAPPVEAVAEAESPILAPMPQAPAQTVATLATPDAVAVDTSALTLPPALSGVGGTTVPAVAAAPVPSGGGSGPGIAPFLIPAAVGVAVNSLRDNAGSQGVNPVTDTTQPAGVNPNTDTTQPVGVNGTGNTGTTNTGGTNTGTGNGSETNGGNGVIPGTNGGTTGDNTGSGNTGSTNSDSTNAGGTNIGGESNGGTNTGSTNSGETNTGGTNSGSTNAGETNGGTNTGSTNSGGTNVGGEVNGGNTGGVNSGSTNVGETNGGNTGGGETGGGETGGLNVGGGGEIGISTPNPTAVPEPGTFALFAAAGLPAFAAARRRFKKSE